MGQIVKRKKKGRPSKADLAKRGSSAAAPVAPDLRRRNVRYNIDYDDDFEEKDERRREKKLKLVLKLNQGQEGEPPSPPLPPSRGRGVSSAAALGRHAVKDEVEEEEEEDEESERRKKTIKKRRIDGGDEEEEVDDDEDDDHGDGDAEVCTKSFVRVYQQQLKASENTEKLKKKKIKIVSVFFDVIVVVGGGKERILGRKITAEGQLSKITTNRI